MSASLTLLDAAVHGLPASVAASPPRPADFSDTPFWLTLVKALGILVYLLLSAVIVIWFERKVIGRMQLRPGPNRHGPFGLFQTLGDALKLMTKEDMTPAKVDRFVYTLAPLISGTLAFGIFAIIPLGPEVWMFGHKTPLQLTDSGVAVLLALAVAGVGIYGIVLAGWSSGSTYPLLGGVRASAQMVSYEIAMGLALVAVFLYSGSMSTSQIVANQGSLWHILPLAFSFVVYVITMVGETNRLPFDLAEGEGELTGGFHTEYSSGMRFGMFYLGEYINMFNVSALATTMFLGGWQAPPPLTMVNNGMFNHGWWPLVWFTLKLWLFIWFFVWLRGSLPRVRYDQFMRFGWKFLIPTTLTWVVFVAFFQGIRNGWMGERSQLGPFTFWPAMLILFGIVIVVVFLAAWAWDGRQAAKDAEIHPETPAEVDPFAGGYPVPPLPGQRLLEPSHRDRQQPSGAQTVSSATRSSAGSTTAPTQEDTRA